MKTFNTRVVFLWISLLATTSSFVPIESNRRRVPADMMITRQPTQPLTTSLWNTPENKKKKPYDEKLRKKLLSESIAPWRTIRLFLYGSLGSGAFVGGFIQLTGLLAALSSGKQDIDMNTEVTTLYRDRYNESLRRCSFLSHTRYYLPPNTWTPR